MPWHDSDDFGLRPLANGALTEDRRNFGKTLRPIGREFFLPGALFPNLCAPSQFLFLYFCPLVANFC